MPEGTHGSTAGLAFTLPRPGGAAGMEGLLKWRL
jgi:hypothetical protein